MVWGDKVLPAGSQPVAANESHAILALNLILTLSRPFEARQSQYHALGIFFSNAAGFSHPEILAISLEEWD